MDHSDHVDLLKPARLTQGGSWADLGAGSGAFTFALRELIGAAANIHAVDKDRSSLNELEGGYKSRFGSSDHLNIIVGDFSRALSLPPLDGVLMANSLHFFKEKVSVMKHVKSFLKPNGILAHRGIQRGFRQSLGSLSVFIWNIQENCASRRFFRAASACHQTLPVFAGILFRRSASNGFVICRATRN
jgi:ubiquinone/menaquinone biosynthesis C-methylase UbiE